MIRLPPRLRFFLGEMFGLAASLVRGFCLGMGVLALAVAAHAETQTIPPAARHYRSELTRCARAEFGLSAPVATLAAQIHQESLWRSDARSPVGAVGLAQFMPSTARWLPLVAPQTGEPAPLNPGWSLRAVCAYDRWLLARVSGRGCERWAFSLAAYNGGLGWVRKDARLAAARGLDPARWWNSVEAVNAGRSRANWEENRGYPRRILLVLEPLYREAGWGPGVCQ